MKELRLYYRLTKPGIVYSNAMTAIAGFLLASGRHIDLVLLVYTAVGMGLVVAAACVFNNYLDRGIDSKMARTKSRALASGALGTSNALIFGSALAAVGFLALTKANLLTMLVALGGLFGYVVVYGFAKRKSEHGTLVGTVPGAACLVAGYTAVSNRLGAEALILFLIMVAWQMPHFYAIAINRYKDYKAAGLPVLPVKRGVNATKAQMIFYCLMFLAANLLLFIFGYTRYAYLVVMLAISLYWLSLAVRGVRAPDNKRWARGVFGFSLVSLLIFCLMLSLNAWLP